MATILDALVVQLGLDPKGFTQGQREAAASAAAFQKTLDDHDAKSKARDAAAGQRQQAVSKSDTAAKTRDVATRSAVEKKADQERQQVLKAETQRRAVTDKSEKDAVSDKAKVEREAQKKRAEGFTLAKDAALGFGAALAAVGIEKFVTSVASGVAQTGRISHNLDMSTRDVAAWGLAIEKSVGGSAAEATTSLATLGTALMKLRTGQSPQLLELFARLQFADPQHEMLSAKNPDGTNASTLQLMKKLSEVGQRTDPQMFSSAMADAGFDQGTVNFLEKGPAYVQQEFASGQSRAPSDKEAEADQKAAAAATLLEQRLVRLGQVLVLKVAPDFIRFLADVSSLMDLFSGKIGVGEFWKLRDQHKADAVTEAKADADALKDPDAPKQVYGPPDPNAKPGIVSRIKSALGIPTAAPALPKDVEAEVRKDAAARGVDPDTAVALFRTEGGGKVGTSPRGAFGPAQLMPGTAAGLGLATSPDDADYSWRSNVDGGIRYLAQQIQLYKGNVQAGEAAYNAGPNGKGVAYFAASGDPSRLPLETQNYIARIQASLAPSASVGVAAAANNNTKSTTDNSSENHIGAIHIHGVDTNNARSVAAGMSGALSNHPLVAQSNTGLS